MNKLHNIVESLSDTEKRELKNILTSSRVQLKTILEENNVSMRLFMALESASKKYSFVDEITSQRFLALPNCGKRTLEEFEIILLKKYKIQLK